MKEKEKSRKNDQERLLFLEKKLVILETLNAIILFCSIPLFICILYVLLHIFLEQYNFFKLFIIIVASISIVYVFEEFIEKVYRRMNQRLETEHNEIFLRVQRKELFDKKSNISLKDDSKIKDSVLKKLFERTSYQLNELDDGTYEILFTAKIDETFRFHLKDLYEVLENVEIDK